MSRHLILVLLFTLRNGLGENEKVAVNVPAYFREEHNA